VARTQQGGRIQQDEGGSQGGAPTPVALDVEQVQRDDLCALLSTVKDGAGSEAEAIKRLSPSPHWV
jgi:hypothetical protein